MLTLNPPLTLCFELIGVTAQVVTHVSCNISNTGKSVLSDTGIQTQRSGLKKTRHSRVFFNQPVSVWTSDETPFQVFDIRNLSKQ